MNGFLQLLVTSAAAAGLLGGVHCAAMCGGIVGAVCGNRGAGAPWRRALAYNFGRIASYVVAGALIAGVGQAGLWLKGDAVVRKTLMLGAGATLIVLALFLLGWSPLVRSIEGAGAVLWRRLQPYTRHFLPADTVPRAFGLGLLWGWLPCGMVYAVLLTAAATGNVAHGALVMAAFGLGTLPNLLAMTVFAHQLQRHSGLRGLRVAGAVAIAVLGAYGVLHAVMPQALHGITACITGG